jgi:hypothetical protein
MKKMVIALSFVALLVFALYFGARSILPHFMKAVVSGKSPHNAIGTVLRKEHIRGPANQGTGTLDGERFHVHYRLNDFYGLAAAERNVVLEAEQVRFAKEGPRKMEVGQEEYENFVEGGKITIKYAYYPSVLWGVSSEIRVPW